MAKQLGEALDSLIPEALARTKPVISTRERAWVYAAIVNATPDGSLHEPCPLESLDVLRCGGERHLKWRRQLADCVLPARKAGEHCAAGLIAQRMTHEIETFSRMFNHMVEHSTHCQIVNPLVE